MPERAAWRAEWWFVLFLVFSQVYYAHRWWFRYGDEDTSGTYTATPPSWQAGKYLVILLVTVGVLVLLLRSRHRPSDSGGFAGAVGVVLVACVVLTAVNAARVGAAGVASQVADWSFLPLVLAVPFFWRGKESLLLFGRVGAVLVVYHAVFEAVQVAAYLGWDRLPALAYPGGLVRFGGGLDDPNGFGLLLVLPIVVVLALWSPSYRARSVGLLALLLGMLLLTLSYSAFAALAVGLAVFFVVARDGAQAVVTTVAVGLVGAVVVSTSWFQDAVADKAASALSRFDSSWTVAGRYSVADYFPRASTIDVLLGVPDLQVESENAFLALLADYGIVVPVAIGLLAVLTVIRGASRARARRTVGDERSARVSAALTAYVAAFTVASVGVPNFTVFPVNVTFWVVAMVLWLPWLPSSTVQNVVDMPADARSASSTT